MRIATGIRRAAGALAMSLVLAGALVPVMGFVTGTQAEAATNAAATNAINNIKKQAGSIPGQCGWKSWNPYPSGWTNCKAGCWYFVANVEKKLVGCYPSGTSGYKLTRPGDFNTVGTITDSPTANPSMSGLQTLMKKACPGDVIQFKGGPSGWGSYQHTAIVEAVDDSGITIFQHGDSSHVTSTRYNWSYFYNNYLDFDAWTNYTKGITLYHYKNYGSKFPSHTHNFNQKANLTRTASDQAGFHKVKYTRTCSCGATNGTSTELEACTYNTSSSTLKCSVCGVECSAGAAATYNGRLYERYDASVSWSVAKAFCEARGGHLVTITTSGEQKAVTQLVSNAPLNGYSLGISDAAKEGEWRWVTGEQLAYSNWAQGEPNNANGGENFASMYRNGTWNDIKDSVSSNGFVCEFDNPKASASIENGGALYECFEASISWDEAKAFCEAKGGHLVTITSAAEQQVVEQLIARASASRELFWIGASDAAKEGDWRWVTGEEFGFSNWAKGEPNNVNGGENYANMYRNGTWNDTASSTNGKPCWAFIMETDPKTCAGEHVPGRVMRENEVSATCSAPGSYAEVTFCSVCGSEIGRVTKTVPMLEHTSVIDPAISATTTTSGLTEGSHCSVCGAVIKAQQVVPMLGSVPQKLQVLVSAKKVKATTLKKKSVKVFIFVNKAEGSVSYKVTSGSPKHISVSHNGIVTLKKGAKKGTYKVKVTAAATEAYLAASKTVAITVK